MPMTSIQLMLFIEALLESQWDVIRVGEEGKGEAEREVLRDTEAEAHR